MLTQSRHSTLNRGVPRTLRELEQANDQDPRNLYRLSLAFQAKGNGDKAREYCLKAAQFNSLPALNYSFIRAKAQKAAAAKAHCAALSFSSRSRATSTNLS